MLKYSFSSVKKMDKRKIILFLIKMTLVIIVITAMDIVFSNSKENQRAIKLDPESHVHVHSHSLMELELVVTFPLITDPDFDFHGLNEDDEKKKEDRMNEYITCLIRNLNHRYISHVHLLYDQPNLVNYVNSRIQAGLRNKLTLYKVSDTILCVNIFKFIFTNLQGKLIMYMQADNYLGDGFDRIDKNLLKDNRHMYALTRWGQLEEKCDMKKDKETNTCSTSLYEGSHDAYILVPQGNLSEEALLKLNQQNFNLGIDNLIVYTFRTLLEYKVTNPCLAMKIYHLHCSSVRNASRQHRVFPQNENSSAIPTDSMI